ncbi:MAG: hypothetical protein ACXU86_05690 [Archangium sp.]
MPYVDRNYTHFQMIAYETPTLKPEAPGGDAPAVNYVPVPNDVGNVDATTRLKRLAWVVNRALQEQRFTGDNANVLKIFMVPEFFFRPNTGVSNSYDLPTGGAIMLALKRMFSNAVFRDWLFVIGSIIYREVGQGRNIFWNSAVVIKGGYAGKDVPFMFVDKRYISGIDGLPQNRGPLEHPYLQDGMSAWETKRRSLNTIDGVSFGIEICLDHGLGYNGGQSGYLRDVAVEYRRRHGVAPAKLHLLTACGMPLNTAAVAAYTDGYILRVDGHYANQPAPGWGTPVSEVRKVTAQDFQGNVVLGAAVAERWSVDVPVGRRAVDTQAVAGGAVRMNQRIVAYLPQVL